MAIGGTTLKWLEAAIERGDALGAWSLAADLRGRISLDYALALVLLVTDDHARFDRACARWLQRWDTEHPAGARSDDRARIAGALADLPDLEAITVLGDICNRLRLVQADRALEHLLPRSRRLASASTAASVAGGPLK